MLIIWSGAYSGYTSYGKFPNIVGLCRRARNLEEFNKSETSLGAGKYPTASTISGAIGKASPMAGPFWTYRIRGGVSTPYRVVDRWARNSREGGDNNPTIIVDNKFALAF